MKKNQEYRSAALNRSRDFTCVNVEVVKALADSEGMKQLDGSIVALTSCSPAGTALGA